MIRLALTDVREFLRRSRRITNPGVLPVLSYIKLQVQDASATLTKTNLVAWCLHETEAEGADESLLLDEKILSAFTAQADGDHLTLEQKGGRVVLSDGRALVAHEWVDPATFPATPEAGRVEATVLPAAVLEQVRLAHPFTQHLELESQYCFVHLCENELFATNGYVMHHHRFPEELPALVLRPETAAIVGEHEALTYYTAGNYDFFDTGRTRYGFIRPEHTTPAYRALLQGVQRSVWTALARRELLAFCELALASIPKGHLVVVTLYPQSAEAVQATCRVEALNIHLDRTLVAAGAPLERPFSFQPQYVAPYLRALPYEMLYLSPLGGAHCALWSEGDESYTGVLAGMQSD